MATFGSRNPRNIKAMVAAGEITQAQANRLLKKAAANKVAKKKTTKTKKAKKY